MNAAPFVFCGILFVTRFYHFTCGAALRLTKAHCTRMYVCARGYICMFVWHSQNQIITFAYASAEAAVAWWASAMMMTTTMTIAEQREWQWQWKREREWECVFLGWWRWRRGVNNDESNPHMQRENGRERVRPGWRVTFAVSDILPSNKDWSGLNYTHNPGLGHFDCKRCEWLRILCATPRYTRACVSVCVCRFIHACLHTCVSVCVCVCVCGECLSLCVRLCWVYDAASALAKRWQIFYYHILWFYESPDMNHWVTSHTHTHVHTLPHNTAS